MLFVGIPPFAGHVNLGSSSICFPTQRNNIGPAVINTPVHHVGFEVGHGTVSTRSSCAIMFDGRRRLLPPSPRAALLQVQFYSNKEQQFTCQLAPAATARPQAELISRVEVRLGGWQPKFQKFEETFGAGREKPVGHQGLASGRFGTGPGYS